MAKACENTVEPVHQLPPYSAVSGDGGNGHPRVLFIGNSITLHMPKPDIGWTGSWGMAASAPERDYVHIVMRHLRARHPDASYKIAQVADWERAYWQGRAALDAYRQAVDWQPDIVIARVGENIPDDALKEHPLTPAFIEMMDFFNPQAGAQEIITSLFWHVADKGAAIAQAARMRGVPLVDISRLGEIDAMMALDRFEHRGVAMHPGDEGMMEIAKAILSQIPMD